VALKLLAHYCVSTIGGKEQKTQTIFQIVPSSGASKFSHLLFLDNFNGYAVSSNFVVLCVRVSFYSTHFDNGPPL
jgi:hypothetical protein